MKSSYFITIFLLLQACTHDPLIINEPIVQGNPCENPIPISLPVDTCFEFSFNMPNGPEYETIQEELSFQYPVWSPEYTSSDFMHVNINITSNTSPVASLWKNNLCNRNPVLILSELTPAIRNIKWGINGSILMATFTDEIWVMKSNGDSLYQIPVGRDCLYPNWYNEELIYCTCRFPEIPEQFLSLLINMDGEIVDTFDLAIGGYNIYNNKLATYGIAGNGRSLGYVDLSTEAYIPVIDHDPDLQGNVIDMAWIDNTHMVWIDRKGIHKINTETAEIQTLKENCSVSFYSNISYNRLSVIPNTDEILLGRHDFSYTEDDKIYATGSISKLNINTGEEVILELE